MAAEVAAGLGAPLEVFVACKVGSPGHEELGIGAVAEGLGQAVVSDAAHELGVTMRDLQALAAHAHAEVERRIRLYRGDRVVPDLTGRQVVLVDDGLATGVTAEAALRSLQGRRPSRVVLAVPVCAAPTAGRLADLADAVISVAAPNPFVAVGQWYRDFSQTTDDEVIEIVNRPQRRVR